MSTFETHQQALVGGINSIQCVPILGVDSFPPISKLQVPEMEIAFLSNYAWLELPILSESARYEEAETETDHGALYQKDLTALLPADLLANRQALLKLRHLNLLVKYRDHLGNHKLLNSPEEPMRLTVSFKTETYGGQLGFTLQFKGQHTRPSSFLTLPNLPQFSLNADGKLIYQGDLSQTFSLNSAGQLVVDGNQKARFSLDSKGRVIFT